ncbi:hypothetical protein ACHAPC_010299 [Botrytis cinerea]|uniref:Similar to aflatoxin biosynthesis ketoreductase nor-1 n=2 Tax=Botryotinia fuckeliana TaxID=40559 RepID=G2YBW5_BOTF4|nr:putative aflatoxin biosynthesis ketoreductase nor-1 protein [Botrytis cinerea BcDW1]CCD34706.1 similar to aflatoxin biosynthesis ketoreductase nor-1 [Botrytis cinerea T4]
MSNTKTYIITGANRGIGRGFVEALIQRPNTTVIAGVRDLSSPTSKSLSDLPLATGTRIIPLLVSSSDELSPSQAVQELQNTHGIKHIDVVIANAGISQWHGKVSEMPLSEVREHFEVNTIGVLTLYQATLPLLLKSTNPVFMAVTSGVSSIGAMGDIPLPVPAYGMSKAALNYMVRKIHFEHEKLIAFVICPGWVQTDMGKSVADMGVEAAPVSTEESVKGMLEKIDNATREGISGTFQAFDEKKYPW